MGLGALTDVVRPRAGDRHPDRRGDRAHHAQRGRRARIGLLRHPGPGHDGWSFIPDAVERGAAAVVAERETPTVDVPQIIVANARHAVADAADAWFGRPSEQLRVFGITGTDGKSHDLVPALAVLLRWSPPGLVGTVDTGRRRPDPPRPAGPRPPRHSSCRRCWPTWSTPATTRDHRGHLPGLAQSRVRNCRFQVGVVTTITSEHLEFHGTLEAYRAAKALLIEEAPVAVLNADDADSSSFVSARPARSSATGSRRRTCGPPPSTSGRTARASTSPARAGEGP